MKTETTVKDKSALDVSVAAKEGYSILGKSVIKKDTMEKILGSAKFAADMELPNMLYGGVFRSTICHGVIKSFDPSAALAIPGVVTVLTSKDIPGKNRIGIILKDEPILVDDKIRRYGDAIAVVAAETPDLVQDALDAIKAVSYTHLDQTGVVGEHGGGIGGDGDADARPGPAEGGLDLVVLADDMGAEALLAASADQHLPVASVGDQGFVLKLLQSDGAAAGCEMCIRDRG